MQSDPFTVGPSTGDGGSPEHVRPGTVFARLAADYDARVVIPARGQVKNSRHVSRVLLIRVAVLGLGLLTGFLLFKVVHRLPTLAAAPVEPVVVPDTAGEPADTVLRIPSAAEIPVGKQPVEMSDRQIVTLLYRGLATERNTIEALREATSRRIPDAVDASVTPLQSRSLPVRIATFEMLTALGDRRIVPRLLPALEDTDPLVRGAAARTLGSLGDRSVLEALFSRYFAEETSEVKVALRRATEQLSGLPFNEAHALEALEIH